MNRPLHTGVVLLLLVVASGASCPRRLATTASLPPELFAQPPGLQQLLMAINANTERVQRMQAQGATLSISGLPSLQTSLALERPRRFRMQAGTMLGAELDIGSNEELWWMWARRNEPPATYYARHDRPLTPAAQQLLPVPPTWLIEALGLVQVDPSEMWDGPYPRGNGQLELRGRVTVSGRPGTKVLVVDERRATILEQAVYDETGQLLAVARLSRHEFDPHHQVTLPMRVEVRIPPTQMTFAIDVEGYTLNHVIGDAHLLWNMPEYTGAPPVEL